MKKFFKVLLIVVLVPVIAAAGLIVYLSVTEYKPEAEEAVRVNALGESETPGSSVSIVSWNIGYCGLGERADFVMDGGAGDGRPESREEFMGYYEGVQSVLRELDADIYMLQEVDQDSRRSYGLNETEALPQSLSQYSSVFALNYSCDFVPFPWPPIGRVNSGVLTMTDYALSGDGERVALPCPFSWPLRVANLKRCLLVSRVTLPDTDAELVLVNLHLEAYDSGEGKAAQTAELMDLIAEEYEKGNYVVAGGDFNQTFPGGLETYPMQSGDLWAPGTLSEADLPEGFTFAYDASSPSCRSLDRPLDAADPAFQYYLIDGFILSPNVRLTSVETLDKGFLCSDHNPVSLTVELEGLTPEAPAEPETRDFILSAEGTEETVTMTYTDLSTESCPDVGIYMDAERFQTRLFEGEYDILPLGSDGDPLAVLHTVYFPESADVLAERALTESGGYFAFTDRGMVKLGGYDAYCLSFENASEDDGSFFGYRYYIPRDGGTVCVSVTAYGEAMEGMLPRLLLMADSIVIK